MAFATELTLTTGQTIYEGDPENEGRIQSREVRVSVTYSLEREDGDPQVVALAKTPEVEETLGAAWRQIRAHTRGQAAKQQVARLMAAGNMPPVDDEQNNDEPDGTGTGISPVPIHPSGAPTNGNCHGVPAQATRLGGSAQDSLCRSTVPHQNGDTSLRRTTTASKNGATATATRPADIAASPSVEEGLTKPQLLAIRAACGRLRMSEVDAFQMMEEDYPVRRLELLTKAHAAKMLHSLQQHEWRGGDGPKDDEQVKLPGRKKDMGEQTH